ncbi:endonuclease/exonuclease/phosphatase family protein [Vibrio aestuarianus]|uniref:endonuclease/exonuclease/phosphatase family protein n=1 Tax=Vibrio aestuarianus TaxID=28171 RepID=UPI00159306F3|nr:endonuclease/exonuclease/phosphatase family protein [Vibrio aestuarianus]MDE1233420.1 endonuclease/exonuclease/phosphatase family protein [Vibrio aestuarianus]MDE1244298.1 endonuclease/exonuclease/phosphatase family protein [Vibrio aestuarianus]NGZ64396.1 endonuclease/exonuclease/phosphatase family protein [Vibrio aestuarianus subsp. cardii]
MKKKYLIALPVFVIFIAVVSFFFIFTIPSQPQILTINHQNSASPLVCYDNPNAQVIDANGQLELLVWNIYKQNRVNWHSELDKFSQSSQLLLLQEASMTEALKSWIVERQWGGNQAAAFRVFGESAGVLNLSKQMPSYACAYTEVEPWLRLPKSAIYALYRLSDGQSLAAVNLHAVNFTYGTDEYANQLSTLISKLDEHKGPVIVAGDFNSWSEQRMAAMKTALQGAGMQEVIFSPDHRIQFVTGLVLDHVFYRGLTVINAKAPQTDASDHNPMLVHFSL